jgi:hypothetical protein
MTCKSVDLAENHENGPRRLWARNHIGNPSFLWSSVGAEYARKIAAQHGLTDFFEGCTAKPDIVIDDMPGTAQASFVYNVHEEASWQSLAERIIAKHVD